MSDGRLHIVFGTGQVGPTGGQPMTEDLPLAATGVKGRARAAMTAGLLAAADAGRVRIAIGRASDFFGPGVIQGITLCRFRWAPPGRRPARVTAGRNRLETSGEDDEAMRQRRILIGCDFTYLAAVHTPVILQVRPGESAGLALGGEQWSSRPPMAVRSYTDLYGNPCTRAVLSAGRSSFGYHAVATVPDAAENADDTAPETAPDDLPDDTLIYILPSRYCLPDVLADEAWSRFGGLAPGYRRVQAICGYVHDHLTFQYGSTTTLSTAADVNAAGRGVCRDFTHLAISFCRALNIPARYVFGYLPGLDVPPDPAPMDFAAWMEVWLSGRWWTFDPRNNARRKGRVVIGRGRDASDVAMATTFGGPDLESMSVQAEEAPG